MPRAVTGKMHLRPLTSASVIAALLFACGQSDDKNEAQQQGIRSLDPSTFDRTCSRDSECVLVDPTSECSSCCNSAEAVRDTSELQSALAELAKGCEVRKACAMKCFHAPACVNGRCEKKATAQGADGG